ncbi:MAG TPA: Gmad2 immunoglobulin-like domain-containing protein, partial [Roseiflexaceae bacterium]|nr:Gmad2 immunoglobulin-like domain-containing protein [Roseiflexaceae bacterium]
VVGSPVVLTGRTALVPPGGQLTYRVLDASGRQIGAGAFNVTQAGDGATFNAPLTFQEPAGGGQIRAELTAPTLTGSTSASVDLVVAPPQQITIDTPPPGTFVGSPVVLTGRLARLPFDSNLKYRILDSQGRQLGAGLIPVSGAPGQPTSFNASLTFDTPLTGGAIRAELADQRAADGFVAARAAIDLQVAPAQQAIFIDTPPPGTLVGSPVVITGRTVVYPLDGNLAYQIFSANGIQLGVGAFNVVGAPGQSTTFNAQLFFNLPAGGGPIQVNLYDQNGATGAIVASAVISLQVAPPQPNQQVITIETPPAGTVVGSPVVVTGRTSIYPSEGNLAYRVRDQSGLEIGSGVFQVSGAPGQPATFVASLLFKPPSSGGMIRVEIIDLNQSGAVLAISALDLQVNPQLPPIVRPTPSR